MGLFKKQSKEDDNAIVHRLCQNAGNIIAMLKSVLNVQEDEGRWLLLAYASGLAGHACHMAVIANKESFAKVRTDEGKIFYFGDSVNKYLLEDRLSVLRFINGAYRFACPKEESPNALPVIKNAASMIGNQQYKIWDRYSPSEVFTAVKSCWDGIFDNMTARYCKNASEWPVLFGIVLQNVLVEMTKLDPPDVLFSAALECTLIVSKMDTDSL